MLPGAHRQVHRRANGSVAIYWYASRGGAQIGAFKGSSLEEAEAAEMDGVAEIARAYGEARDWRPAIGLFGRVVAEYRQHPDFQNLKPDTQRTYRPWLERTAARFGRMGERDVTEAEVANWLNDVLRLHGARAHDHALRVFTRLCSWGRSPARGQRLLSAGFNPARELKTLYKAPPQDHWPARDIEKIAGCRREIADALLLALNTGLRRADLVAVTWEAVDYEAGVIRWVTSKGRRKGRRVVIALTKPLRKLLATIERRGDTILTNSYGGPWTVNSLGHAIDQDLQRLGVKGRLHGLRRSAATHLSKQGLSSRKIARVLGWSEADAEAMAAIYVDDEAA